MTPEMTSDCDTCRQSCLPGRMNFVLCALDYCQKLAAMRPVFHRRLLVTMNYRLPQCHHRQHNGGGQTVLNPDEIYSENKHFQMRKLRLEGKLEAKTQKIVPSKLTGILAGADCC